MSFCHVFGFFHIDVVSHLEFATLDPLVKTTSSKTVRPVSLFPIYKSSISNSRAPITGASIRAPSPFRGELLEQGTFVFVVGVLCVRAAGFDCVVDANQMELFPTVPTPPNEPAGRTYTPFPALYITAYGIITGPQYRLFDRKTVVPIRVSQTVRDSFETFEVACVVCIPVDCRVLNSKSTGAC